MTPKARPEGISAAVADASWADVWQKKGLAAAATSTTLADLIRADGFDTATGAVDVDAWRRRAAAIADALGVAAGREVLEVGCGAGAMLCALRDRGATLTGVDPAGALLDVARRALPEAHFTVGHAQALPCADASFDAVFCHSVFAYFDDDADVDAAIAEFARVARTGAPIAILDVPDLALRDACEAERARLVGSTATGRGGLHHLYVAREHIAVAAALAGRVVTFVDDDSDGVDADAKRNLHAMSRFRFDAWLRRP